MQSWHVLHLPLPASFGRSRNGRQLFFGAVGNRGWVHSFLSGASKNEISNNIIKGRDFINDYNSEIFKFLILSVHYRSILNFNQTIINQSVGNLIKIYTALQLAENIMGSDISINQNELYDKEFEIYNEKIEGFLNSDMNTPGVFGVFFDVVRKFNLLSVNKKISGESKYFAERFLNLFKTYGTILGLFQESKSNFVKELNILMLNSKSINLSDIENKILVRNKARASKNYQLSDQIRDELLKDSIELKDNPDGSTDWSVKI